MIWTTSVPQTTIPKATRPQLIVEVLVVEVVLFGEEVDRCREAAEHVATAGKYHIQVVLDQQLSSLDSVPHLKWKSFFGRDFPLLLEPAVRLLTMGTQSADVERCCKVHKLIHTKMRNRMKNENVRS